MNDWKILSLLGGGSAILMSLATACRTLLLMPPKDSAEILGNVAVLCTVFGGLGLGAFLAGAIYVTIHGE